MIEAGVDRCGCTFSAFPLWAFQFSGRRLFTALGYSRHAIFFSLLAQCGDRGAADAAAAKVDSGVNGVFLAEPVSMPRRAGLLRDHVFYALPQIEGIVTNLEQKDPALEYNCSCSGVFLMIYWRKYSFSLERSLSITENYQSVYFSYLLCLRFIGCSFQSIWFSFRERRGRRGRRIQKKPPPGSGMPKRQGRRRSRQGGLTVQTCLVPEASGDVTYAMTRFP